MRPCVDAGCLFDHLECKKRTAAEHVIAPAVGLGCNLVETRTFQPSVLDVALNDNALDLVERDLIGPPVIELRRASRGVVGHLRGLLQLATILQIGGDPGAVEGVIADGRLDAGLSGTTPTAEDSDSELTNEALKACDLNERVETPAHW